MTADDICNAVIAYNKAMFAQPEDQKDQAAAMGAALAAVRDALAPEYKIPGPYDIAMQFGAAIVAAGKVDNVAAAMTQAWAAVPEFYKARDWYLQDFLPMRMGLPLNPVEGATNDDFDAG